jgi:hypothetical protein
MHELKLSTMALSVLFIMGCSREQTPEPPPAKTVFDPLVQSEERAREVQKTVDQNSESTRKAIENQERGDNPP